VAIMTSRIRQTLMEEMRKEIDRKVIVEKVRVPDARVPLP